MATKLQEARARLREAEAAALAVKAKHAAEDKAAAPAMARVERMDKAGNRAPIVIRSAGAHVVYYGGVYDLGGYGWDNTLREAAEGKTGRAAQEAVAAAILSGAVTINVGGGTSKCKGIASRTAFVTPADLRKIKAAQRKVTLAEEALRKAQREKNAAIEAAHANGGTIEAPVLASQLADYFLAKRAARGTIYWMRDREIADARTVVEAAQAHLAHVQAKSKDPCQCATCESDRRVAEMEKIAAEREATKAKAAAAWQRIVERAKTLTYVCPHCAKTVTAKAIPTRDWQGQISTIPYVKCPECGFAADSRAVKVARKAAAA